MMTDTVMLREVCFSTCTTCTDGATVRDIDADDLVRRPPMTKNKLGRHAL
jgi:hypothetical protein